MKTSHLILYLFAVIIYSCGQRESKNEYSEFGFDSENYNEDGQGTHSEYQIQGQNNSNSLKPYKIMSKQFGMVFGIMPIPQSWQVANTNKENVLFEGPNGVKVYGEQFKSYYFSNNQQQNYYAQQGGSDVQPIKSIDRLINEDFKPYLQTKGLRLVGQFPLPQLAQSDTRFNNSVFKSTPEQRQYQCIVTEWEDQKGNKSIGIIRYYIAQYTAIGGSDWGYTINAMEAPQPAYEQAKKEFIYSLINFQVNPQWLQANNQYYAQLSQQNNAGHQQRMAAIQAQGQAAINNGNTYSSIADSNYESWKRRNAMSDAGQARTIDGINERSNMQDQNGNQYKVEGYYNNVWKGSNDQYIGTNNTNWNPNIDKATNSANWEQLDNSDDNNY